MLSKTKPASIFYRRRSRHRRNMRVLFPSPAELAFIKIMGGTYIKIGWPKSRHTKFALALCMSLGKIMKAENMQREVRVGKCWVDFGNDIKRAIEIDGAAWHTDVLADEERDKYLAERGWRVLHIPAHHVFKKPEIVREKVTAFLLN